MSQESINLRATVGICAFKEIIILINIVILVFYNFCVDLYKFYRLLDWMDGIILLVFLINVVMCYFCIL